MEQKSCDSCILSCACRYCRANKTCAMSTMVHCFPIKRCGKINEGYTRSEECKDEIIFNE